MSARVWRDRARRQGRTPNRVRWHVRPGERLRGRIERRRTKQPGVRPRVLDIRQASSKRSVRNGYRRVVGSHRGSDLFELYTVLRGPRRQVRRPVVRSRPAALEHGLVYGLVDKVDDRRRPRLRRPIDRTIVPITMLTKKPLQDIGNIRLFEGVVEFGRVGAGFDFDFAPEGEAMEAGFRHQPVHRDLGP